jgi:imidazolonepropionase-like amidohydrolase
MSLSLFLALLLPAAQAAGPPIEIRDVSVIDVRTGRTLPNRTVLVRSGVIEAVTDRPTNTAGAQIVDGRGLVAMPGLVDLHTHLEADDLPLLLANGITTARELNGSPTALAWRGQIASGQRLGPTLLVGSPMLAGKAQQWRHSLVTTAQAAADSANRYAAMGYDFLKVYDGLTPDAYMAIVAVGEEYQLPVLGHVPEEVGLDRVLSHGQAGIEHMNQVVIRAVGHNFDTTLVAGIVAKFAGKRTAVSPTLASIEALTDSRSSWFASLFERPEMRYTPPGVKGWWASMRVTSSGAIGIPGGTSAYISYLRRVTKALAVAGVDILVGTDTPNPMMVPGFSLVQEMQALERAGLDRASILRSATLGAAEHLRMADVVGTIEVGKRADLVLLGANPLDDLAAAQAVRGVVVRGTWLSQERLQQELDRVAGGRGAP